jgi:AcrR family transcriptional regulator
MPTEAEPSGGLRARKKEATRRALHEAASRLMADLGPTAVTVDMICAQAGVSPRTFFNYFDTKEEAFFPWQQHSGPQITATIRDCPPQASTFEAAATAIKHLFRNTMTDDRWPKQHGLMRAHPELLPAALRMGRALQQAIADGLAQRTGLPADDLYIQTVAAASIAAMRVVGQNWDRTAGQNLDDLVDHVFGVLTSGAALPGDL